MTLAIILAAIAIILFLSKRWIDNEDISRIADILSIVLVIASFTQVPGFVSSLGETPESPDSNSENVKNDETTISGNPKDFFPELSQFPQYLEIMEDRSYSNRDISKGKENPSEILANLDSNGRIISHVYFFRPLTNVRVKKISLLFNFRQ